MVNYTSDDTVDFIKGTHIRHEMYKEIQFIYDKKTSFYEVICTKHDNTECHLYIGYDGSTARRAYNRVLASAEDNVK